ncbi:XS domain-containing protein [Heracleum sosnowskyi]|uniref:XS domain-containing protein n=1 Tax=Heracleum sosnowskyi TaxID=360622 RepID=A0AAD8MRX2_9APIA|nr:XS domain-containing protein [Heracleum sosnowskyi]
MSNQRHHSFRNHSPVGDDLRFRDRRVEVGSDAFIMRRSLSPVSRRNGNNLVERRDSDWDLRACGGRVMSSRSPQNDRKLVNYGNRSRSPPIGQMRKMPSYGNRSRSPGIDQMRKMPNYGNRSRSPGIEPMRRMPNHGNRSRSPGIEHMRKMPNYRTRSRSPGIEHMRKMPNYGNRSRSPPIDQLRKIPNSGIRSRSPPADQMRRMPDYGVDVLRKDSSLAEMQRMHDPYEYMNVRSDANAGLKNTSRVIRDGFDGMLGREPMELQDRTSRGLYRMPADMRRPSENIESARDISLTSMKMGLDRFNDERIPYREPLLSEKFSGEKEEKTRFRINDAPYTMLPPPQSMDFTGPPQFKDFGSSSSRNTRVDWDGLPLNKDPPFARDEYFRDSAKLTDHMGYGDHGGRRVLDSGRSPEGERKGLSIRKKEILSPLRGDHNNYLYERTTLGDIDVLEFGRDPKTGTDTFSPSRTIPRSYLYPRREIEGTNDHPSVEMYGRSERIDYDSRPNMLDPVTQLRDATEFSRRKVANNSLQEYPSLEKQSMGNHIGMSRSSIASPKYMDTVIAQGRKAPREEEMPYFDDLNDHERMLHMTSNYNHARDAAPVYYKERMRSSEFHPETDFHRHPEESIRSTEFHNGREMHRHPVRRHENEGEEDSRIDLSHRVIKRRHHTLDEEMHWSDSREIPRNWNSSSRTQYQDDRNEDWTRQHTRNSYSSKRVAYDRDTDRSQRFSNRTDTHRFSAYEDRALSYERGEHMLEHSIRGQRSGDKYSRGYMKPGSVSHSDSYQYNRKNLFPKSQNVWMRNKDGNKVDVQNEVSLLENRESFTKSEPSEDSEEFKQLVYNHFLFFTRKLNDNYAVRRRYKEQGRAGSLFCLVCGRSESKEFTDTRRLATHAFMSHKVGLRTQHLGLHKAICVLLGWKSEVAPNVVTWSPETISSAETLAQKEDLIIWPPVVVVHDSSTSDPGPTMEALEIFIKGKGVTGGKVKIAKHNIMVVKFLGTSSGVQDAEKLHKYFLENKRGRVDFSKINSSKHKISKIDGKNPEDKLDETELYGYMGIAEDLDQVDFDTKKKCSIRSKKEIQDIVDAPIKPE